MKRRSLIKSVVTAGVGAPLLGCVNYNNTDNQQLKNIKHNPIGVSTYSFWQFNGRETPIEYCIEKSAEFGFDGVQRWHLLGDNLVFTDHLHIVGITLQLMIIVKTMLHVAALDAGIESIRGVCRHLVAEQVKRQRIMKVQLLLNCR